jgi:RNA polymerase primary sigma factor
LIKTNLRFVVSVAKQYQNQGLSLPRPYNEGNLGLIKAAQRFDETKDLNSFLTQYGDKAKYCLRLAEQSRIVKVPVM